MSSSTVWVTQRYRTKWMVNAGSERCKHSRVPGIEIERLWRRCLLVLLVTLHSHGRLQYQRCVSDQQTLSVLNLSIYLSIYLFTSIYSLLSIDFYLSLYYKYLYTYFYLSTSIMYLFNFLSLSLPLSTFECAVPYLQYLLYLHLYLNLYLTLSLPLDYLSFHLCR